MEPDNSKTIDEIVRILRTPCSEMPHEERLLQDAILNGYNAIHNKSSQLRAVMTYLDNLIAWADNLFQQDTVESISEAVALYLLAVLPKRHPVEKKPSKKKTKAQRRSAKSRSKSKLKP